jgi:hypothetical protein
MNFWRKLFGLPLREDPNVRRARAGRAQREREPDDPPPPLAGVGAPLVPKTPLLSGSAAQAIPREDSTGGADAVA